MAEVKMVVGLGNPGREYAGTRHNIGFQVIDSLAEALGIKLKKKKFGAVFGKGRFAGRKLILLKPWRFMNRSGDAVAAAMGFCELGSSDILVVVDDMALEPGRIRIRAKGTAGGHKGLADVIEKVGMENINRLRIGIGPRDNESAVDFVLDRPTETEKPLLDEAIVRAREAVLYWLEFGIGAAMNKFNPPMAGTKGGN